MAKIWALSVTFQNFLISEKFAIVAITIISAILLLQLFEPFVAISRLRFGSEVSTLLRSYKLYTDNLLTYSLTHFYWNEDLQKELDAMKSALKEHVKLSQHHLM